jgi:competence protein ComEA
MRRGGGTYSRESDSQRRVDRRPTESVAGLEIVRATPATGVDAILVHVSGAVGGSGCDRGRARGPCVDVIDRAPGFAREADESAVNLARRVLDEDQIHVPQAGEADALLDLNLTLTKELEELPGIGPVYAGRIVEARAAVPLSLSDELNERELISPRTYEQIRDLVMAGLP